VPIEQVFAKEFAVPVVAENDANLAALAEWTWGAGRGAEEFLYVMCSSGVGDGLIVDGRIYRGGGGLLLRQQRLPDHVRVRTIDSARARVLGRYPTVAP
jgi:hypothetical protein